jgi:integrative and conjugative element protein (TIGR02256 family)
LSRAHLRFQTSDAQFGLSLGVSTVDKMLKFCESEARTETGGILVGFYTKARDWAIVTDLSGPPDDSKRSRASFDRGTKGLQGWLSHLWNSSRHYYLGEWHFHPCASPEASDVDRRQLKENSENARLVCPEPVMLIVGGDPSSSWEARAYVHPRGKGFLRMDRLPRGGLGGTASDY